MRALLPLLVAACGASAPPLHVTGGDATLRRQSEAGRRRVEAYFGASFPRPVEVQVFADRAAFDVHMREVFRDPGFDSACWMVGVGTGRGFALLDPARWKTEACDHEGSAAEVERIVAHELTHVYQCQLNPLLDAEPERFEAMGWFVEGVAVVVSGQLDEPHQAPASEAVAAGKAPARLADAWSGKYRYGVSGSLVAYVEARAGRAAIKRMLVATSPEELLAAAGTDEPSLLRDWEAWVRR